MNRQRRRALRLAVELLDDRCLLSGLTPSQVTNAYGLNAITFNANGQTIPGDGSGQTIAIIDAYHDPYLASDLNTFDQANHLPAAAVAQVDLADSRTDSGWAGRRPSTRSGDAIARGHDRGGRSPVHQPPGPADGAQRREADPGGLGRLDELGRERVPGPDALRRGLHDPGRSYRDHLRRRQR